MILPAFGTYFKLPECISSTATEQQAEGERGLQQGHLQIME